MTLSKTAFKELSNFSFILAFRFLIKNVSISHDTLLNSIYNQIQETINNEVFKILKDPAAPFVNFTPESILSNVVQSDLIQTNATYIFKESNITHPSPFFCQILDISCANATTTTTTTTTFLITTPAGHGTTAGGGFPGWALAIIIPCGILILLVPCWILLRCLLCGCCAAFRRRWQRRSRNIQYRIHDDFF
ncbi:uncharacterized protein LOC108415591 [Arapaima gigas]